MAITLKSGQSHQFTGPEGDFVSVTNEAGSEGQFQLSYEDEPTQTFNIGGFATENKQPTDYPVTVTNSGKTTLSVGLA